MKSLFRETPRLVSVRAKHEPWGPEQVDYEDPTFPGSSPGISLRYSFIFGRRVGPQPQFSTVRVSVVSVECPSALFPSFSHFPASPGAHLCFSAGARFESVSLFRACNIYKVQFSHIVYSDFLPADRAERRRDREENNAAYVKSLRLGHYK